MTRITVVIEDHAEGIHLGQQLAGGRVVSVISDEHIAECIKACDGYTSAELSHGRVIPLHRYSALANQRDELREALEGLLAVVERHDTPLSDPERIAARVAIAKARGN